jgi:hypothetical protein
MGIGVISWIIGVLASICVILGVLTSVELMPVFLPELTGLWWLVLAGVLFLGCIAAAIASRQYD